MEPMIVWTNRDFVEVGGERDFRLDLACGIGDDQENDFVLELPDDIRLEPNCAVFVDGTAWGGVVYGRASDTKRQGVLTWKGRTWHGVMQDRVLYTAEGDGRVAAAGTVAECTSALIAALGLDWIMDAGECPDVEVSHTYTRHPDGWDAIRKMHGGAGLRTEFRVDRTDGNVRVSVGAAEPETLGEIADSELADFSLDRTFTPYNHVIALGRGEGASRDVVHRFADAHGNVSPSQSLFGSAERVLLDDYPNAEHDELVKHAEDKLGDAQAANVVDVTIPAGAGVSLGDMVSAYDQRVDERVESVVSKAIVTVEDGIMEVAWEAAE